MLTSLKIWNEPNNVSHWDFELDPGWDIYARMVESTRRAVRSVDPDLPLVLGGVSPIDPDFFRVIRKKIALPEMDAIAVHGFPFDWNLWPAEEFPARIDALREEFGLPVWVTETGASSFGGERLAAWGTRRLAHLLEDEKVYWYTLLDLPPRYRATTRHHEAEGCSYWRHFHFGLLRHDGTPKRSLDAFDPSFGVCQWFNFRDEETLARAVRWLGELGVEEVRTGLSWAESRREGGWEWLDTIMEALQPFRVCATLCFTPPDRGLREHHTSPPEDVDEFARFARRVVERYGSATADGPAVASAAAAGTEGGGGDAPEGSVP